MAQVDTPAPPKPATAAPLLGDEKPAGTGKWMALAAALLGWMFDGAEMGIFSLIGGDAMAALMPTATQGDRDLWFNIIMASFLVGAATGGVVFGWLGDRIGRVRAMTLSVLTYALFTGLCGLAGTATQVGILRFIASLGMGGEWSLGVALVMEVWPNKSRAFMAGLIGAAANVGYLLVGIIGLVLLDWLADLRTGLLRLGMAEASVESLVGHSGWRLVMMLGTLPALLTFFIRIFVPESEKWQKEQGRGTTSHWATQDLLGVVVGAAGPGLIVLLWAWDNPPWPEFKLPVRILGTLAGLAIATAGYTYPVLRYLQRQAASGALDSSRSTLNRMLLAACLSGVALLGTWGTTQQAPTWAKTIAEEAFKKEQTNLVAQNRAVDANKLVKPKAKEHTLIWVSAGAIIGTILAAFSGDWFGRRPAYFLLCFLSMFSVWALYLGNTEYGTAMLTWTFISGVTTASFYGWLPLYLPELFRTSVRATGQGFGFNFGRILAAVGVLQLGNLLKNLTVNWHIGSWELPHGGRPIACSLIALIYLVGMAIIWLAPETRGKPLPD